MVAEGIPQVAEYFLAQREAEFIALDNRKRLIEEANDVRGAVKTAKQQLESAQEALRACKRQITDFQQIQAQKNEVQLVPLGHLGGGHAKGGTQDHAKKRKQVMEKISKLGAELPSAQKLNFDWFKDTWDDVMLKQHGAEWPKLFSEQMQGILDVMKVNPHAFQLFLFQELHRSFNGIQALAIPGHLSQPAITNGA